MCVERVLHLILHTSFAELLIIAVVRINLARVFTSVTLSRLQTCESQRLKFGYVLEGQFIVLLLNEDQCQKGFKAPVSFALLLVKADPACIIMANDPC